MQVRAPFAVVVALALMMGGCSGGGRVSESLTDPEALKNKKQAIAFFRVPTPDPACLSLAVQLGTREGQFYKLAQTVKLERMAVTNVAEVLLDPGEYHIISFVCYRARSVQFLAEPQGNGLSRRSYASFTVSSGEVVNLGQVKVVANGKSAGIWGSFRNVTIEVSDWPLAELERFKSQRPKHYAEMKVRLMTAQVASNTPEAAAQSCEQLRRLQTEGKVQNLPAACTTPQAPTSPAVQPAAVKSQQKA